jgi:predicted phage terminase large subunit-like protein
VGDAAGEGRASVSAPPTLAGVERDLIARKGFAEFVRRAWPQVEPAPLVWGWHLDAICEHLEAVARREIRDLVINVPPGCSKSLLASVLWPAWVWTLDPTRRFIVASYAERVVLRDARKSRKLVDGDWFQARFPQVQIPRDRTASTALSIFNTSVEGMRFSTTVPGGDVTGQHCHDAMVDDPINPHSAEAASGVGLDAVLDWWCGVMPTRFLDHATSTRSLIMQRVHERDLTREFVRAGATVLCLPMEFDRSHPHRYRKDPRTEEGELLCPARIPPAEVERIKTQLGPTRAASQLGQRPNPASGGIIKRVWVQNYWTVLPKGGTWTLSIDCAFKALSDSDYVCIQAWYAVGACFYLVDQLLEQLSFTETCDAVVTWSAKYPGALEKLVEDKANGTAVMDAMKATVMGLVPVEPEGGKVARAFAAQPLFAAFNVFVPHPTRAEYPDGRRGAPWVRGLGVPEDAPEAAAGSYEHSLVTFPRAANDDDVDATTQYLNHASKNGMALFEAAMANMERMFGAAPAPSKAAAPLPAPRALAPIKTTEPAAPAAKGWR